MRSNISKSALALIARLGLTEQMDVQVPKPKFIHGTSTNSDFDRIINQVFMPDANGIVSASFGLRIAASNPAMKEFFDNLNAPLPPESGLSENAKSPELLERPTGVVTYADRKQYIDRLKEFIRINSAKPKKKED